MDFFRKQTDLADRVKRVSVDGEPISVSRSPIAGDVAKDPFPDLVVGKGPLPCFHHAGILKHPAEDREILFIHLPKEETFRFKNPVWVTGLFFHFSIVSSADSS